ncbi:MAG: TRAP transporter small permease subunit [Hydrogenophaga sp.]|nr:TRAP transporter small permease subunit [Hydrogenophaga sp.]
MSRLVHAFYQGLLGLSCLSMLAAFGSVALGVVARQARWDIPGLDAYAGYAIVCALFLALPATLASGDHIRVTLVLDRLSPAMRGAMEWPLRMPWWCAGRAAISCPSPAARLPAPNDRLTEAPHGPKTERTTWTS